MTKALSAFVLKMERDELPPTVIDTFSHYYRQLAAGESGLISDTDIQPLTPDDILDAASLEAYTAAGQAAMSKAVAIVLNGGLGTSMGLTKAKSLIPVKAEQTFLDIKLKQAEHRGSQLAFMNSFNTHSDTVAAVSAAATKLQGGSSPAGGASQGMWIRTILADIARQSSFGSRLQFFTRSGPASSVTQK